MGNPKAFLTIERKEAGYRPVLDRVSDYGEVEQTLNTNDRILQASRCMDCGVAFCHWACPLGNKMPEWQDMIYKGKWNEAIDILHSTNNFPEFTGRICPAPCEKSCVLSLAEAPVTIRENEAAAIEHAFAEGYIKPRPPKNRTGKKVAVIGSGPAGLACADQLNKKGHSVVVFEKNDAIGGLLRYGIPDFKLNKLIIDRRLHVLSEEGIVFKTNAEIGKDISIDEIQKEFDAICLTMGSGEPRDLNVEGRNLDGIHFAMEFLHQQNQLVANKKVPENELISAKGKSVLVIGGGDTGSDCVGTSIRQGATHVIQIELLPKPPIGKNPDTPWPMYPNVLNTSSSHHEGCERRWSLNTKSVQGENGKVTGVVIEEVDWSKDDNGAWKMNGTGKVETIKADLILLALGFIHPVHEGLLNNLGLNFDQRGNVQVDAQMQSSKAKFFAAGDTVSGASLVVRAIDSGRKVAEKINSFLK
ncbi:MAG TPA: glutamate synthase subunit beta [Prolixibacteraceae bacterium]|nr:glutamate synthase subunit beta [Prolixibacteraceae bacterium]